MALVNNARIVATEMINFARTLERELAEAQAENKRLVLKAASSLANNLCPDHRDKQAGKPCLACEIERMRPVVLAAASCVHDNWPQIRLVLLEAVHDYEKAKP